MPCGNTGCSIGILGYAGARGRQPSKMVSDVVVAVAWRLFIGGYSIHPPGDERRVRNKQSFLLEGDCSQCSHCCLLI